MRNQWKTLRQRVIRENEWLFGMIIVRQNTEKTQNYSPFFFFNQNIFKSLQNSKDLVHKVFRKKERDSKKQKKFMF